MSADETVDFDDITAAASRIGGRVHHTPVFTSRSLDAASGNQLFFKAENLQRCGAFKARGACNAIARLPAEAASRGVITDSSGNHGQALAWAATQAGLACRVVMPADAPAVKQAAVAAYGAQIHLCTPTLAGRAEAVARLRAQTGACYIPPFNHPDIIAGQGTVALELLQAHPDLDALVLPVGGGGLMAGCAIAGQGMRPGLRVFAAEPTGANDAARSKAAGRHLPPDREHRSVAGGLLVGLGSLNWPSLRDRVEAVLEVEDAETLAAMRLLASRMKLVVEPSGAIGLAAVLSGRLPLRGARIGVVLSGGNVDLAQLGADAP